MHTQREDLDLASLERGLVTLRDELREKRLAQGWEIRDEHDR
jgi:hypothetical protein